MKPSIVVIIALALTASSALADRVQILDMRSPATVQNMSGMPAQPEPEFQGHDLVAYRTSGRREKGDARFAAMVGGAVYFFSSAENQMTFARNPEKFTTPPVSMRGRH